MLPRTRLAFTAASAFAFASSPLQIARADLSIDSYNVNVYADDTSGVQTDGAFGGSLILPASLSPSITVGDSFASSSYLINTLGIASSFTHARAGATDSFADSIGAIFFHVDQDMLYSANGGYALTGSQVILSRMYVHDETDDVFLFDSYHVDAFQANQSFTLGQPGGVINVETGSLTGTLLVGHSYKFYHDVQISASLEDDGGATAGGTFNLNLTAIPAPSSAVLTLLGLGMLIRVSAARRRA